MITCAYALQMEGLPSDTADTKANISAAITETQAYDSVNNILFDDLAYYSGIDVMSFAKVNTMLHDCIVGSCITRYNYPTISIKLTS